MPLRTGFITSRFTDVTSLAGQITYDVDPFLAGLDVRSGDDDHTSVRAMPTFVTIVLLHEICLATGTVLFPDSRLACREPTARGKPLKR